MIGSKRKETDSNSYGDKGTMKFETIDRGFANDELNVWF